MTRNRKESRILIELTDITTWPDQILNFLKSNEHLCIDWECNGTNLFTYEKIQAELNSLLVQYSLIGYHCTKLTKSEIEDIRLTGMLLPDDKLLLRKIDNLLANNLIGSSFAMTLKKNHKASEQSRLGKIWFCFYKPYLAGNGIDRLLNLWGGESLYSSYEKFSNEYNILSNIGIPSIVISEVPIKSIKKSRLPSEAVIRTFLVNLGYKTLNSPLYESYSQEKVKSSQIIDIVTYPNSDFFVLTRFKTPEAI